MIITNITCNQKFDKLNFFIVSYNMINQKIPMHGQTINLQLYMGAQINEREREREDLECKILPEQSISLSPETCRSE